MTKIWTPSLLLLLLKLLLLLLVSVALDVLSAGCFGHADEPALDVVLRLLLLLVGTAFSKRWCPPDTGADAAFAVEADAAVAREHSFGRALGLSAGSCFGRAFGKACWLCRALGKAC